MLSGCESFNCRCNKNAFPSVSISSHDIVTAVSGQDETHDEKAAVVDN